MSDSFLKKLTTISNVKERSVNLPKGTEKLCATAFKDNINTAKISCNEELKILEESAFQNCLNLRKVYFPLNTKIMSFPNSCFENCINLEYFSIPRTVSDIRHNAFKNCTNIKTLTIPDSVVYIDLTAFEGWTSCQEIVINKDYGIFTNCEAKITKLFDEIDYNQSSVFDKSLGIRYFAVKCKCGHVSKQYYMPIVFSVKAKNRKEAALIARKLPRVKHNHKDAILENQEISYVEFLEIMKINKIDPYLNVSSPHEQEEIFDLIKNRLIPETGERVKSKKVKNITKKHYLGKEEIRDFKKYMNYIF